MSVKMREPGIRLLVLAALWTWCCALPGCQSTHEFMADTGKAVHSLVDRPDVAQAAKAVKSADPDIRRQAVLELGRGEIRDVETLGDVLALLMLVLKDDEEPMVRAAAASSLGYWRQQAATMPLVAALKDKSEMVRQEVVRSLARIKDRDAVDALIVSLQMDPSAGVRAAAASGLAEFERADIPGVLIATFDDRSLSVRFAASHALTKMTGKEYGLDKHAWEGWLQSSCKHTGEE